MESITVDVLVLQVICMASNVPAATVTDSVPMTLQLSLTFSLPWLGAFPAVEVIRTV